MTAVRRLTLLLIPLGTALGGLAPAKQDPARKVSVDTTGVYLEEQAQRGDTAYAGECARCHSIRDHTNPDFQLAWNGRTVRALYDYIRGTMPDDAPGVLTEDQYLNVTAYLLKVNGMLPGRVRLTSDTVALAAAKIAFKAGRP